VSLNRFDCFFYITLGLWHDEVLIFRKTVYPPNY
jgi:hypothetical protein